MMQAMRFLLAAGLFFLTLPLAAAAQSTDPPFILSTTGSPIYNFTIELEAGETSRQTFAISDAAATLRVANVTSPPNGGLVADDENGPLAAPASWLSLDAGANQNRTLTIAVPFSATSGRYVAALVLEGSSDPVAGATGIAEQQRAVAFVAVTVPGEMEAGLAIGMPTIVTSGLVRVVIPVENSGTIPLAPTGVLRLESAVEETVDLPIQMGMIVAGAETSLDLMLPATIAPGKYTLRLTLSDEASSAQADMPSAGIVIPQPDRAVSTPATGASSSLVSFSNPRVEIRGLPVTSATISATIANDGSPIVSATVILEVRRNGQPLEAIPIVEFARIPDGAIAFSTVYVPEEGFMPGLWTFSLSLETAGSDGEPETIAQSGVIAKIDVP